MWSLTPDGEVQGKVAKHPSLRNGEEILTSCLSCPHLAATDAIVATRSGSLYRLRKPGKPSVKISRTIRPQSSSPSGKVPSLRIPSLKIPGMEATTPSKMIESTIDYDLNGETLGDGKYLLAGSPVPTKNKRSCTMTAYLAGPDGNPRGDALIVKFSNNEDAMTREHTNFQKLWSTVKRGVIVRCFDYYPNADSTQSHKMQCALVLERGTQDLKQFRHVFDTIDDATLKNALWMVARCMSGIHSARYVWTDLKTENFVSFEDTEKKGKLTFKGIDLESAVPVKGHPIDYTPEACPPEFARAFEDKEPQSFVLEYSYDVWSFGMMALELSMGECYFEKLGIRRWDAIMKKVAALDDSSIDVSSLVSDETLASLITQCLTVDPKKRPTSQAILKHPYFRGIGLQSMFGSW